MQLFTTNRDRKAFYAKEIAGKLVGWAGVVYNKNETPLYDHIPAYAKHKNRALVQNEASWMCASRVSRVIKTDEKGRRYVNEGGGSSSGSYKLYITEVQDSVHSLYAQLPQL